MIRKKLLSESIKSAYTNIPVVTIEGNGLQDSKFSHETIYYNKVGRVDTLKILSLGLDSFAVLDIKAMHVYGDCAQVRLYIASLDTYGGFQVKTTIEGGGYILEAIHLYMDKNNRDIFMTVRSPLFCDYTLEAYRGCTLLHENIDIDIAQLTEIALSKSIAN